MPGVIATTTTGFFYGAEPSATVIAWQDAPHRERLIARSRARPTGATWAPLPLAKPVPCASELTREDNSDVLAEQPKTQADHTIAQLIRFQNLGDDWDGSGAARPLSPSIKDARRFIRSLAPESAIPRATLHADGHAVLLLRGANVYAELEFLGQGRIGFYARRDGQEWGDEFSFDGGALPIGLSQIGFVTEQ
jgi:hypothetical protein